jgi:hypothetical protein
LVYCTAPEKCKGKHDMKYGQTVEPKVVCHNDADCGGSLKCRREDDFGKDADIKVCK